jgi:hypothetical protein
LTRLQAHDPSGPAAEQLNASHDQQSLDTSAFFSLIFGLGTFALFAEEAVNLVVVPKINTEYEAAHRHQTVDDPGRRQRV